MHLANSACMYVRVLSVLAALLVSTITPATSCADDKAQTKQLDVGDKVVDFDLPVVGDDGYVKLSDHYKQGPVVVVILRGYPGYQCPLCSRQLGALANRAKTLAQETEKVILVYPGEASLLEDHADDFMGSRSLPDPLIIVRDEGMGMVDSWGLRWNAPNETAYPAAYVIDGNGRVAWKKVSDSHAGRSSVEEILKALRKL